MNKKRSKKKFEGQTFWQSYSDMMAALLLMFVLIIVFTFVQAKSTYEEKEAELKMQSEELVKQNEKLESQNKKIVKYQKQVAKQQKQLDSVVGVRKEIVEKLNRKFSNSYLNVSIDSETGSICFDSSVLFDYNKYKLKKSGINFLKQFFPKYFEVILSDDIRKYISEVIIEGHTDNQGEYLYNLDLSQKRAYAVAEYCLGDKSNMFTKSKLEKVREIVTANGRSYYELKYYKNGKVNAKASRRVEVKFRLTEEEMIGEMAKILEN